MVQEINPGLWLGGGRHFEFCKRISNLAQVAAALKGTDPGVNAEARRWKPATVPRHLPDRHVDTRGWTKRWLGMLHLPPKAFWERWSVSAGELRVGVAATVPGHPEEVERGR